MGNGEIPGGNGTSVFTGVGSIALKIEQIVEDITRRGHHAKEQEAGRSLLELDHIIDSMSQQDRDENKGVFCPLVGPHGPNGRPGSGLRLAGEDPGIWMSRQNSID
jgi:hypothetical protein